MSDFDAAYKAASAADTPDANDERVQDDELENTDSEDEDGVDGSEEPEGDQDETTAEDEEEEEDPDASDSEADSDEGDSIKFDESIYDALKDNPDALKRLKAHEKGVRKIVDQAQAGEALIFKSEPEQLKGAFELMAEARGMTPQQLIEAMYGTSPTKATAKPQGDDDWDPEELSFDELEAKGYMSAKEVILERKLNAMQQQIADMSAATQKAEAERKQAERERVENERIERQAKSVQTRLKSETGWDLAPKKVAEAMRKFPNLDPIQAAKAMYPDDYADFKAGLKGRVKKGPSLPKRGSRNPETQVPHKGGFKAMYQHASQLADE